MRADLTYFQERRVAEVVMEMNGIATKEHGVSGNLFIMPDSQVLIAPGPAYEGNKDLYETLQAVYSPLIDQISKKVNPFSGVAKEAVATTLWNIPGVFRYTSKPPHYKLQNTTKSPIYVNCRLPISHPEAMNLISSFFQAEYIHSCNEADQIVGGEVAGIYYATWLANMMSMEMGTARKPKEHGIPSSLDGRVFDGDTVLLVEDLITDAGSKKNFINGVRKVGGKVEDLFVVFDRQQGGGEKLLEDGIALHSLTDMDNFLKTGRKLGRIKDGEIEDIEEYRHDPKAWNEKHDYEWAPK